MKKKLKIFSQLFFVFYILAYIILSINGRYYGKVVSGKARYNFGLGVPDVYVWQPKYMLLLPYDFNYLGTFYFGPIWLDRCFWHKDVPIYSAFPPKMVMKEDHPLLICLPYCSDYYEPPHVGCYMV
jgi:hypothetical protein